MKRFYEQASAAAVDDGFAIQLDGRTIKTPAKQALILPAAPAAEAVAQEWQDQGDEIDPDGMPFTRYANTALDQVAAKPEETRAEIKGFASADLLCYRAAHPKELVAAQTEQWDPWVTWAEQRFDLSLKVTNGVVHVSQSERVIQGLTGPVDVLSDFEVPAFHDLVTVSGSLILALALREGALDAEDAFPIAFLEEIYQAQAWGADTEAEERRARLQVTMDTAVQFLRLLA